MNKYLSNINSPVDIKKLSVAELRELSDEIRDVLIKRITVTGGHMGSNLGLVEATVALHYVFNSPKDKFVFDVSHQSYTHKILTGRKYAFIEEDKYHSVTGYTNPQESEHDFFTIGHTSTSISLAVGLAKARDLKGDNENIVAIIGDGSMSGGEAFEGLNNAAMLNSNMIVLFNDNEMSISENQGGMYHNFELLRKTKGKAECNFFKSFGLDYYYIDDGNDISQLVSVFQQVKDTTKPTVIHVHTLKGKGLEWAEQDKEAGHWAMPEGFDAMAFAQMETYENITEKYLLEKIKNDPSVIAISPATPGANGLTPEFRIKAGKQFIDVGIAEEHAVAFASGIAKNGGKPVLVAFGSFLQRTYDQLSQDLSLNGNAATILVFGGGLSDGDVTHLGSYDISMMSNIPNLVCLSPVTKEEYLSMLDWSIEQNDYPVAIRVPSEVISSCKESKFDTDMMNSYKIDEKGSKVAILGLGNFYSLGQRVKKLLKDETGIDATLINPRIYTSVDKEVLESLKSDHEIVITLEDGILDGGFGEKIARYYGSDSMKVLNFGGKKEFTDRVELEELYNRYHLTPELIVTDIKCCL